MSREEWRQILSQRDWRKMLPYAPIAAIVVVIVAALGMDLAFGAPGKPKVDNSAPPPEVIRATIAAAPVSPTPYAPPPTATPTAAPTEDTGPVAQQRDQRRIEDLAHIATALVKYDEDKGEFPSTGGNIQTLCTYRDNDAGCKVGDILDPIPEDPLRRLRHKRLLVRVGRKDLHAHRRHGPVHQRNAGEGATRNGRSTRKKTNLYCLTGP